MDTMLSWWHYLSAGDSRKHCVAMCVAVLVIYFVPVIHLGVVNVIWTPDKPEINKTKCKCGCWDTIMKGSYEKPPAGYKNVYINTTTSTAHMWFIVIVGVVCLYEVSRYIVKLIWEHQLRVPFLLVLLSTVYPHYYAWWGYINYINDTFYDQWWHQTFFTVTELVSTAVVVHLCNSNNQPQPWKLLIIIVVSAMHIFVSSFDQFVKNVLFHKGRMFQITRDLGLMTPDLLHLFISTYFLNILARQKRTRIWRLFSRLELITGFTTAVVLSVIAKNL